MDEPTDGGDQSLIDEEVRRRRRNNARLRKEEEEQRLIAEGMGPRKAKTDALKNALWNKIERPKRQRSPSPEETTRVGQPEQGRRNGVKPQNKRLQVDIEEGNKQSGGQRKGRAEDDGKKEKRTGSSGHRNSTVNVNNAAPALQVNPTNLKTVKSIQTRKPAKQQATIAVQDESSNLSSLSGSEDEHHEENGIRRLSGSESEGGDKSGGDGSDDNGFDVGQMSAKEAQEVLDKEMPQVVVDPHHLFDDDVDVEIPGHRRHRASSSEASRPPTSESEGRLNSSGEEEIGDSNEDSDVPMHISVPSRKPHRSKSESKPSKRDLALHSERPKFQAERSTGNKQPVTKKKTAVIVLSDEDDQGIAEDHWPKAIQLRVGALTQQRDIVRAVCREGIKIVEKTLITQQAWPELNQGMLYRRQVLLEAVEVLRTKHTDDSDGKQKQDEVNRALKKRIVCDEAFVRTIGKWVVDRLSHHRGVIRHAASDHIALFQLGVGDTCSKRVHALLENDVYVYPGHWASDKDGKPVWMAKATSTDVQIYLNPALIDIIKTAFFAGPTAFGYKFMASYVSAHPDLKEPELTISVVALGATAFFAALYEWRDGKKAKSSSDSK